MNELPVVVACSGCFFASLIWDERDLLDERERERERERENQEVALAAVCCSCRLLPSNSSQGLRNSVGWRHAHTHTHTSTGQIGFLVNLLAQALPCSRARVPPARSQPQTLFVRLGFCGRR